jgi:hypothetical protein
MICSSHCKHYGRCDHEPGDDCFEPRPITQLCARALTEGDFELRRLALTLHRSENLAFANQVALIAMEMKDSGLLS